MGYIEWLKNLQHVDHGRLTKRYNEKTQRELFNMVKSTDHSPDILKNIKGASERDIAMSALEEIMCSTVAE